MSDIATYSSFVFALQHIRQFYATDNGLTITLYSGIWCIDNDINVFLFGIRCIYNLCLIIDNIQILSSNCCVILINDNLIWFSIGYDCIINDIIT